MTFTVEQIEENTFKKTVPVFLENYEHNKPLITPFNFHSAGPKPAIVISAGPSLRLQNPAPFLHAIRKHFTIIAADGALRYLLSNGLVPDYLVCVDPHARIVRWFGDPYIDFKPDDDYFRRQDLDIMMAESKTNDKLVALVNRHAGHIRLFLSVGIHPDVSERVRQAKFPTFWFTPMLDDPANPESLARKIALETKTPAINTGGNVGSLAYIIANTILDAPKTALLGFDFSYAPGTPHSMTQYYGQQTEFIDVYNPHLKQTWFTDPVYHAYAEVFKMIQKQYGWETWNLSQGGILFNDSIKWSTLQDFAGQLAGAKA